MKHLALINCHVERSETSGYRCEFIFCRPDSSSAEGRLTMTDAHSKDYKGKEKMVAKESGQKSPVGSVGLGITSRASLFSLAFLAAAVIAGFTSKSNAMVINLDPSVYNTVDKVNEFFSNFVHSPDPCDIINLPKDTEYIIGTAYTPGFVLPNGVNNIIWNWNGSRLIGPGKDNDAWGVEVLVPFPVSQFRRVHLF